MRPAPKARTAEKKRKAAPKAARPARKPSIEPRVLAAIGLALEDERIAAARASDLGAGSSPLSQWTALGRVRDAGNLV